MFAAKCMAHVLYARSTCATTASELGCVVDNVDAFITDARMAGVRILQDPYDQAFGRVAVITDPDGYVIQVFSPKHAGAARR